MKHIIIFLFFLILLPVAISITLDADISISQNDIVTETITVIFQTDQPYDSFSFTTFSEPLSVVYDGDYTIQELNNSYVITFKKRITQDNNKITFSLLFNDVVTRKGSDRVFRTGFSSELADEILVTLTLPTGFVLVDKAPQATPAPEKIITDGQRIKLKWHFTDDSVIAVFYTGPANFSAFFIFGAVIIIVITVCLFLYFKKCFKTIITETLSQDEQLIVEELRNGVKIQKTIAFNLNFSKSKMSKLLRKLEEKGLIEKVPYFKTNKITLKKIR